MTKRILVVDDHDDNQKIVRDLLGTADYEMMEAENGGGRTDLMESAHRW